MSRRIVALAILAVAGLAPAMALAGSSMRASLASELVAPAEWDDYFPFRLGDSWTYDWSTQGRLAAQGTAVRTRVFDGTSFLSDSIGYKLVSDDGSYHLYTFDKGVLAIHSSLEAGRYFDYEPSVVIAAPDLRVGEPRVVEQPYAKRRWTTTLVGIAATEVPLGRFDRALAVQVDMEGPDYVSSATYYFAPQVGLVAHKYSLKDKAQGELLLGVDARLRLARLGGVNVAGPGDLARLASSRATASGEDRGLRDLLRSAMEKRYTWDHRFPGFRGDVQLIEAGKAPITGSFVVAPDLSVKVDAADDATRAALRNEISSFVTHRKPTAFDLVYAETTFVKKAARPDGAVVAVAAGDPLATTYTVKDGMIVEMGRSMGRVSYIAREKSQLRTEDGRTITVDYDVVYESNESRKTLSVEHTRDSYSRLAGYWVPQGRRVEKQEGEGPAVTRELTLTNLR